MPLKDKPLPHRTKLFTKENQVRMPSDSNHPRQEKTGKISQEQVSLEEKFTPEMPLRRFDELIVPEEVSSRINAVISRIQNHKILYEDWGLATIDPFGKRVAINLYGPPGTGKSFCADAIANFMGKRIIRINYAEIESKYVGDTPKNITAAFHKAMETDSVLFFDEADSILGRRLTNVTQSADHGVNVSRSVMLLQLDQFNGVVLFATNLAKNYDEAFVRRIMAHVEFQLPDHTSRVRLWEMHIPKTLPISENVNSQDLAVNSEGLSGGDIKNVVINAASLAVVRNGHEKQIRHEDLLSEIAHSRAAKKHIGHHSSEPVFKEETIPIEDAPPEVQGKILDIKSSESAI